MYNQHTRGMATTRHRSLGERAGRKALLKTLKQTVKWNYLFPGKFIPNMLFPYSKIWYNLIW